MGTEHVGAPLVGVRVWSYTVVLLRYKQRIGKFDVEIPRMVTRSTPTKKFDIIGMIFGLNLLPRCERSVFRIPFSSLNYGLCRVNLIFPF